MTGCYIRVLRDGSWQNIEVEYLTREERAEALGNKPAKILLTWINVLCDTIKEMEKAG